jgi:phenylacetate-CoA ligase
MPGPLLVRLARVQRLPRRHAAGHEAICLQPSAGLRRGDGRSGPTCPPGATGRLLITDLNNYVFPFIRYDTGDLATSAGDEFVGGWKVVDAIEGRSSEVIRLPSGRVVSGVTLGALLFQIHDFDPLIRFYQCAQIEANRLELRVVWRGDPRPDAPSRIASALRTITDPDTVIEVRGVEALETLPSGKVWIVRPLPEETLRPVRSS